MIVAKSGEILTSHGFGGGQVVEAEAQNSPEAAFFGIDGGALLGCESRVRKIRIIEAGERVRVWGEKHRRFGFLFDTNRDGGSHGAALFGNF